MKVDDAIRLRELSERTTVWMLKAQDVPYGARNCHAPTARSASRFAICGAVPASGRRSADNTEADDFSVKDGLSRHAFLCATLLEIGTHEAVPGLVRGVPSWPLADGWIIPSSYHLGWLDSLDHCDA